MGGSIVPDGATPGKINSLSPKNFDLMLSQISISPDLPVEGDDLNADVLVKNIGENQANTFTVELYNDENFDSIPKPVN
ncbi:MAG: hypothetical protein U5K00_01625 [Melioribacteraceae bacterium]|nr:hypothetical protein [Melioribacteraceae bacterium]